MEVGGIRGREALGRLRNVVERIESSWRPATAEEGFEIGRRRLFEPLSGPEAHQQGDVTAQATYLCQDGNRYWYSTQPTVTELAEDRAEQLKQTPGKAVAELDRRLRLDLRQAGDFGRIHPLP